MTHRPPGFYQGLDIGGPAHKVREAQYSTEKSEAQLHKEKLIKAGFLKADPPPPPSKGHGEFRNEVPANKALHDAAQAKKTTAQAAATKLARPPAAKKGFFASLKM